MPGPYCRPGAPENPRQRDASQFAASNPKDRKKLAAMRYPRSPVECISNLLKSDARKFSYSSTPLYGLEGRKLTFDPINYFGLHPLQKAEYGFKNSESCRLSAAKSSPREIRILPQIPVGILALQP